MAGFLSVPASNDMKQADGYFRGIYADISGSDKASG